MKNICLFTIIRKTSVFNYNNISKLKKTLPAIAFFTACMLSGKAQTLFGTTSAGGNVGGGTINKFMPATNKLTVVKSLESIASQPYYTNFIQAGNGKLYGMTFKGGNFNAGTIFSFDPSNSTYTRLKDFDNTNGAHPYGSLMQASNGKLYGMTNEGGSNNAGVIFSFDPSSLNYTKLKDLNETNGSRPSGSLIQASDGKLYGVTNEGGSNNGGVIFSFNPVSSVYTKLKEFNDGTKGANPFGSLIQASNGKLYGITENGGNSFDGVVFSFDPSSFAYTKLKDLARFNDLNPNGSLVQASNGKIYGITAAGGNSDRGIIFSFDPSTSTATYKELKHLNYADGDSPLGGLIQAGNGKLYGLTSQGGHNGAGVIFSFDISTSAYKNLKNFDGANGAYPSGGLLQATDGKLYGMTSAGGSGDDGVIFSFDLLSSTYKKLKNIASNKTGSDIRAGLIQANDKLLYGVTYSGGSNGYGVIFSFDPSLSVYKKLKDFDNINGSGPCPLMQARNGKIYGMTTEGGAKGYGVIFSFDPTTSSYIKLKDFDSTSGAYPNSGLIQAGNGKIYGITPHGGKNDVGVIFSFDTGTFAYTKLKDFNFNSDGYYPTGSLVQAGDGKLYGTTSGGGSNDYGVIFSFNPSTSAYTKLVNLHFYDDDDELSYPVKNLIQASDGKLYGRYVTSGDDIFYSGLFTFDPLSSVYTNLERIVGNAGGGLMQASNGKIYITTGYFEDYAESPDNGAIFSFAPSPSAYTKLKVFDGINGAYPRGEFVEVKGCIAGNTYYRDEDGDGYGNPAISTNGCPIPGGFADNDKDCNDNPATGGTVHPGALEVCNGIDDDCDGKVDSWTLEAEETVLNGAVADTAQPGFTGSGYADFENGTGKYIEWTVNASTGTSFSLQFRYANGGNTNRPLQLKVNGAVVAASLAFSPTGGWATWSSMSVNVNLSAGVNKVRLTTIGSQGPNVDHLTIGFVNCHPGLEAEEAVLSGAAVASAEPGYTGTGYADYNSGPGNYIEWTVTNHLAGSYSLKFRYANGSTANRPLQLKVNGVVVAANLAFSPTGGWATWSVSSSNANFTAATNKVRLTTTGSQGPNVDNLTLEMITCQSATLEAELAAFNGASATAEQPGFTGLGYVDYNSGSGNYIAWTVNAAAAGSFSLKFRYANGGVANRPLKLIINGTVAVASLTFSPTGGWAVWSVSSSTANLIAGVNKIQLTTVDSQGPNVDNLSFSCTTFAQPVQVAMAERELSTVLSHTLGAIVTPNPVEGSTAKLVLSTSSRLPVDFQLVDIAGRNYKFFRHSFNGSNSFSFPTNDLPPGAYIIILRQGTLTAHARLVVGRK